MNSQQLRQQTDDRPDQLAMLARGGEEVVARLDDALGGLSLTDRTAVTLRYLQERPMREVAEILGTTEPAASKRVTRAVARLRGILVRRGIDIAPAALLGVLQQQATLAPPATLTAELTAHAALNASASAPAAVIAKSALASAFWKSAASVGAIAASVLVVAAVAATLVIPAIQPQAVQRVSTSSAHAATTLAQPSGAATGGGPSGPVRVGIYVSLKTAIQRGVQSNAGGRAWGDQFAMADLLATAAAGSFERVPLVEPGSADDAQLAYKLKHYFPGAIPIDVTDTAALSRDVDVIVACEIHYPTDAALASIEQAVRGGKGLFVRQCLGGDDNGYAKPVVRRLRLLADAEPDAIRALRDGDAEIVAAHPLLGALSGMTGKTVKVPAFGGYGTLAANATPLIRMKNLDAITFDKAGPITPKPGYGVYPLAIGQLEQGRIVSCSFDDKTAPRELRPASGGEVAGSFDARALRWAAGRRLE